MRLAFVVDRGETVAADVRDVVRTTLRGASRQFPGRANALTVRFAACDAIQQLNREWRGKDCPTDVLSFPLEGETAEGKPYLGDLAICWDVAQRQARRRRHSATREVALLALHGYLHLLGFDHETDDGEMERLERTLRRALLPPRV